MIANQYYEKIDYLKIVNVSILSKEELKDFLDEVLKLLENVVEELVDIGNRVE